jgi:RNA polymerase sigma-70 factor (ECF subfamily)
LKGEERRSFDGAWLERFHAGERDALEQCYREFFQTVQASVGRVLRGADMETVIHDVFYKLLSDERARRGFSGGSFGAWISRVARNQAIDYVRRHSREQTVDPRAAERMDGGWSDDLEARVEARRIVERFRAEGLPAKWEQVFVVRFVEQLPQREAASRLGISRTTLAYRELRIRRLLRSYVLGGGGQR